MGLTHARIHLRHDHAGSAKEAIECLVDSGAEFSVIPAPLLRRLGIEPHRSITAVLADGTRLHRRVGDAYFEFRGRGAAAPVIFGHSSDEPILGVLTLQALGLVLDPWARRIFPKKAIRF